MSFKIDNFNQDDTIQIQEICKDNMKEYFEKYTEGGWSDEIYKNYCNTHLKDGGVIYTLKDNLKIIGVIMFKIKNKCFYINQLQLKSEYQCKGYGSECLLFIEKLAKKFHCEFLELSVFNKNPAKKLYEKFGFVISQYRSSNLILMRKNFK